MRLSKLRLAALALASGLTLGGCAYGFGDPYGSYGGVNVGYGNYGYGSYGGYGYPYGGYGYGYGNPYGGYGGYGSYYGGYGYPYGWHNGYYYPGTGYYVYDRDRKRRVWSDAERRHWREVIERIKNRSGTSSTTATASIAPRENWSGFKRTRTRSSDSVRTSSITSSDRGRSSRRSSSSSTSSSRSDDRSSDRGRGRDRSNRDRSNRD